MRKIITWLLRLLAILLVIWVFELLFQPQIESNHDDFRVIIPQKALFRNYLEVSVEAQPGTSCELIYISPSGEIHYMDTITADTTGLCTWKWKVDETKGKGAGRLIFTIGGINETHFIEIRSSF
jgi:hypothetical protein